MATVKTVSELILDGLKAKGISSFPPAAHVGACTTPYAVVKASGANQKDSLSTQIQYYTIYCYVPEKQYTNLERFVDSCKAAMTFLEPMVMPTGYETPSFYDDTFKAHMISVQYRNYKRNTSL